MKQDAFEITGEFQNIQNSSVEAVGKFSFSQIFLDIYPSEIPTQVKRKAIKTTENAQTRAYILFMGVKRKKGEKIL